MGKADNSDNEDGRGSTNLMENSVFQPVEAILRGEALTGKRHKTAEKILAARKAYLKELKSDIEEITAAITNTDDFNEMRSLLGTRYAIERTLLAEERNILAEERNLMGEQRTQASIKRTEFSEKRSGFSRIRTALSKRRSFLSEKRTIMAQQRTLLAKARTELAFIRTGVAFAALATGLMRYFGFGWWTVMDASILIIGVLMVVIGVYYYLPIRKQEGGLLSVIRQKEDELMKRQPRILIIDDDPGVCDMLKVYFKKSGFEVEAYVDPYVARQRLEAVRFDVVITDLMMEKMTGIQIASMIKRISPETQVIMISYMPMTDHFIKTVKEDLFDYFPKPLDLKVLHESVKKAIAERMVA
ncbi:MAG: response regulator [Deltaproteobacteria bacterium]|nr:response regulator [Deltaproteobacteria bacterium]